MGGATAPLWLVGLLGTLGLGGGGLLFVSSFTRLRVRRKVADTPTSRVRSVAMGPAELKGLAGPLGEPQVGPFSGLPCAWWRFTVEQEETRETKNGTRREWREIHEEMSGAPFNLEDGDASIPVLPVGAEVNCPQILEQITGNGMGAFGLPLSWFRKGADQANALLGPASVQWASAGFLAPRRRLREWQIGIKRPLYVLGVVRAGRPGEGPNLGQGRAGEPFLITTESEAEVLRRLGWGVWAQMLAGSVIILLTVYLAARALGG